MVQQLLPGKTSNGYVPFAYDISEKAFFGDMDNEVSVKVTHTDIADSRWFTGSGITRKVTVLVEEPVHPSLHGIFFSTLYGDDGKSAQVEVSHELLNESDKKAEVSLVSRLCDGMENRCLRLRLTHSSHRENAKPFPEWMCEQAEAVVSRKSELYVLSTCFSVNGGRNIRFSQKKQESAPSVSMRTKAFS